MKTIINTITIIFFALTINGQNSNLTPFVGNWEWQDGNQKFKVEIFIDGENLKGHYELVETINSTTTTIYKSNKLLNQELDFYFGYAIFGDSVDGIKFGASIDDNVLLNNGNNNIKKGSLAFTIQNNTLGQPITASWSIKSSFGLKSTEEPVEFNIPTDIVLTKVE
jgi:hypothetical protein